MIVKEQDYLEWHGRAGMKWYQHIFGRAQSGAKYASRMSARQIKKQNKRIDKENKISRDRIVNPRGKNGKAAKVETLTNAELKGHDFLYRTGFPDAEATLEKGGYKYVIANKKLIADNTNPQNIANLNGTLL